MLADLASWFTPTVLFCLMNLMIVTIFLSHKPPKPGYDPAHPLARAPSILERARSINFSFHNSDPAHDPNPSLLERVRSINFSTLYSSDPTQGSDPTHHLARAPSLLQRVQSIKISPFTMKQPEPVTQTRSEQTTSMVDRLWSNNLPLHRSESADTDTRKSEPDSDEAKAVGSTRMRKSASERKMKREKKPAEDSPEQRRPATVREKKTALAGEDEEVDEKADDFINKFRQQLKLQRMDSILRFKEMINRGA